MNLLLLLSLLPLSDAIPGIYGAEATTSDSWRPSIGSNLNNRVAEALLTDNLPPTSEKCLQNPGRQRSNFSYTFDYTPSNNRSHWNPINARYESSLFLLQMTFSSHDNEFHNYTVRLGSGGNIYSFYTAKAGEAIPPQMHEQSPFNDEVWQMVSINTQLNKPSDSKAYFIHQAGTYMRDEMLQGKPFFSPTVAAYCNDTQRTCAVASWGQHGESLKSQAAYKASVLNCTFLPNVCALFVLP